MYNKALMNRQIYWAPPHVCDRSKSITSSLYLSCVFFLFWYLYMIWRLIRHPFRWTTKHYCLVEVFTLNLRLIGGFGLLSVLCGVVNSLKPVNSINQCVQKKKPTDHACQLPLMHCDGKRARFSIPVSQNKKNTWKYERKWNKTICFYTLRCNPGVKRTKN